MNNVIKAVIIGVTAYFGYMLVAGTTPEDQASFIGGGSYSGENATEDPTNVYNINVEAGENPYSNIETKKETTVKSSSSSDDVVFKTSSSGKTLGYSQAVTKDNKSYITPTYNTKTSTATVNGQKYSVASSNVASFVESKTKKEKEVSNGTSSATTKKVWSL